MSAAYDWRPSASIETLKKRQVILYNIRHFFNDRGYLEVETPIMADFGVTDVYLEALEVACMGQTKYLQTSPEYHMKRLLAAGSGPIFQIFKAFRNDESGRWHHPEFSMLEWYAPGYDLKEMLQEISDLLTMLLGSTPLQVVSYQSVFETFCDLNPFDAAQQKATHLEAVLNRFGLSTVFQSKDLSAEGALDDVLFLLMSHVIEPKLHDHYQAPVAVIDFPPSQAALARVENGRAKRFEVYFQGIELANGFNELIDADEQLARFERDNQLRQFKTLPQKPIDMRLIEALKAGIPPCTGVALGIDRLCALVLEMPKIQSVLSFLS